MKILLMGAELFREDRKQTDGRTDERTIREQWRSWQSFSTIWRQHQINCERKNVEFLNL